VSATLILGTWNRKKAAELIELLSPHGVAVQTLADVVEAVEIVEDGKTFVENAGKKASQQAAHLGRWVLGEDSGLCVDALGGRPGVYSARFSGPDASDASNNRLLLEELRGVPPEKRSAHYVCCAALSDPSGEIRAESRGTCCGRIRSAPAGTGGFGYDPLFEVLEYHRTFGELGPHVKQVLSHRGRAMRAIVQQIARLLAARRRT
jgi:XTP/dITP diphosphohydrolase